MRITVIVVVIVGAVTLITCVAAWLRQQESVITSVSCLHRCGDPDSGSGCQCSLSCEALGDCCSDYFDRCLSCSNRCSDSSVTGAPCQCDSLCPSDGDCCEDYYDTCGGSSAVGNITDDEIKSLAEELYLLDGHNAAAFITVNVQGLTSSSATDDRAPLPLFTSVESEAFEIETVVLLEALRDNYYLEVTKEENVSDAEVAEEAAFMDAVMATPLMVRLEDFMQEKQLLNNTLRRTIENAWFSLYSRDGFVLGSSGFEHVFVGELDNGAVGGLHNWVIFCREEQSGNMDYMGFLEYLNMSEAGYVFTSRFTWHGVNKPIGGGLIGTSPELELALYTLCFFSRPNSPCWVKTNGVDYYIQTFDYEGKPLVASAYPVVG